MKNLNLKNINLQEINIEEQKVINGGKDGDFLFGVFYGISWFLHEVSENINDLPSGSVSTWG